MTCALRGIMGLVTIMDLVPSEHQRGVRLLPLNPAL